MNNHQNQKNRNAELNANANARLAILRKYLRNAEQFYEEGLTILINNPNTLPVNKRRMNAALAVKAQNIQNTKNEIEHWIAVKTLRNLPENISMRKTAKPQSPHVR
jgi:hypothetical protein